MTRGLLVKKAMGNIILRVKGVLVWLAVSLMVITLVGQMFSLGPPAGMCDQGEYCGKKKPIGKNIKHKKSLAEGWHRPWILAQICHYHGGSLVKIFQPQLCIDVNPGCSPMEPRATMTHHLPCPTPAHLGLLVDREQWLGVGWGYDLSMHMQSCKNRVLYYVCF